MNHHLLTGQEPPACTRINPQAPSPLIIVCDHASNRVPHSLNLLGLKPAQLALHIAHDIGAAGVATQLAEKCAAPLLLANYSRLVIDLNRQLHADSLIPAESDRIAVPGNQHLTRRQRQHRIQEIFIPYHRRQAAMVDQAKAHWGSAVILSVHSFTPCMQGVDRPWHYGVLWDQDRHLAAGLLAGLRRLAGRVVGDNQPYHANHPRGYAFARYAATPGVEIVAIEIRQDLITDPSGQQQVANELYRVCAPLLTAWRTGTRSSPG